MKELLLEKGFKLNEYKEGKYWEYETNTEEQIDKMCEILHQYGVEKIILQCDEDFECRVLYIDCHTWNLSKEDFVSTVEKM